MPITLNNTGICWNGWCPFQLDVSVNFGYCLPGLALACMQSRDRKKTQKGCDSQEHSVGKRPEFVRPQFRLTSHSVRIGRNSIRR